MINYKDIRENLEKVGYTFNTETDTEVIAKLCLYFFKECQNQNPSKPVLFKDVIERTVGVIKGASAIIFQSSLFPNEVCAFKRGSPLILGIKELEEEEIYSAEENGYVSKGSEYFFTSDVNALAEYTRRVMYLEDNDIVHLDSHGHFAFYNAKKKERRRQTILELELSTVSKQNFEHFMLKEIYEQPESLMATMCGRVHFESNRVLLGGIAKYMSSILHSRRLVFIACGTSYHAALSVRSFLEEMTLIPIYVEIASDFLDREPPIFRDDTCFFVSQSGETADTLQVLEYCRKKGALCVGITNTVGSSIARLTDCGVHLNAGPEIGVASTKCYTSQILVMVLIALQSGQDRLSTQNTISKVLTDLSELQSVIRETLKLEPALRDLAERIANVPNIIILARGPQVATCLEAALKIKELAYIPTEGMIGGELKHGTLALVDEHCTLIVIATKDRLQSKILNSLNLVISRKAKPIVFCSNGDSTIPRDNLSEVFEVPSVSEALQPIVNIIPFQLLSYHLSVVRGNDVDKPRNLAKSVTVE